MVGAGYWVGENAIGMSKLFEEFGCVFVLWIEVWMMFFRKLENNFTQRRIDRYVGISRLDLKSWPERFMRLKTGICARPCKISA